jgi:hypothetical protein
MNDVIQRIEDALASLSRCNCITEEVDIAQFVRTLRTEGFVVVERSIFHGKEHIPALDDEPRLVKEGLRMYVRKGDIVLAIHANDTKIAMHSIHWDNNTCHMKLEGEQEILSLQDMSNADWCIMDERSRTLLDAIDQRTGTSPRNRKTIETVEDIRERVSATVEELERDLARLREKDWQDSPIPSAGTILRYEQNYQNARRKTEGVKRKLEEAFLRKHDHLTIASIRECRQYQQEYQSSREDELEAQSKLHDALRAKRMKPIHDFQQAFAPTRIGEVEESLTQARGTLEQIDRIGEVQDIRSSTFVDLTVTSSDDESMVM